MPCAHRIQSRRSNHSARRRLTALEWLARWRALSTCRALIPVAKDDAPLVEIIGRHLDSNAVACERLDAVLLHPAGRVGDDRMAIVELHPIARIGQDFGDETFEFDQFFF